MVHHVLTRLLRLLPAALAVLFAACPPCPEEKKAGPALGLESVSFERTSGGCDSAGRGCATFRLSYPRIVRAPSAAAADSLNAAILSFVLSSHAGGVPAPDPSRAAEGFLEAYRQQREAAGAGGPPWFLERTVSVVFDSLRMATLRLEERSSTGGARGNAATFLRMFDTRTGRRLGTADLLLPGYEPTFRRLGESAFRDARRIAPTRGLDEEGFGFEGGKFMLPANAGVVPGGFLLFYNVDEAGPGALGTTACMVPFDSLHLLVRRDGPLAPIAPWSPERVPQP
jgi:hypothetical protein